MNAANLINFDEYFEKKFVFKPNDDWILPEKNYIFTKERWSISILQNKKSELNGVKSQLNDYNLENWSKHTKSRDPSGAVLNILKKFVQPELLTQAWCKFYECLLHYPIIPVENELPDNYLGTIHLCEAPGAFICALNHKLNLDRSNVQWKWMSTTLNPDYEGNNLQNMIPDDRFIMHTSKNWHFGSDFTGDITNFHNYESLIHAAKSMQKIMIITADGSVDCMEDPGSQESIVEYLHYCEAMTALTLLHKGGSLVTKIFTMFEDSTICLLYLLNYCFQQVNVFKPCTSKSGNSEVYIICLMYKGVSILDNVMSSLLIPYQLKEKHKLALFPLEKIPKSFIDQITCCSDYFMHKQIHTISENIKYFEDNNSAEHRRICRLKTDIATNFCSIYRIEKIDVNCKIVPLYNISDYFSSYFCKQWNSINKWSSTENTIYVKSKSLFSDFKHICDCKLSIVKGKIVKEILHSKFCARDNLSLLKRAFTIQRQKNEISSENTVQIKDIFYTNASEFDKALLLAIKNMLARKPPNIILMEIPILTNFLCGILYILSFAFKSINFSSAGCITFEDIGNCTLVDRYFTEINDSLADLKNNSDRCPGFELDILQVLPSSILNRKLFYDSIWQYNNQLYEIYKQKMFHSKDLY